MRLTKFAQLVALLMLITTAVFAKNTQFNSPEKTIMVSSTKPNFTLTLAANHTTGFSWFLKNYNQAMIVPSSNKYIANKTKKMGAGGHELWTFSLKSQAFVVPHVFTIEMIYAQPWNLDKSRTVKVFKIVTHQ